jgi:hypothetical protein
MRHKGSVRPERIPFRWNVLSIHALAHFLFGKARKTDVSDLRTVMRRYRVSPISATTFPGYALLERI